MARVGAIYGNTAAAEWNWSREAMQSVGYKVADEEAVTATRTQFTPEIIRMRSAGVQFVYLTDNDVEQQAEFLNQAAQQNWHRKVILLESAYDPSFFKLLHPGGSRRCAVRLAVCSLPRRGCKHRA